MGIEVVRRVEPHLSGTAAGGFAGSQDLAYGLADPITSLLADHFGYAAMFLVGGLAISLGFTALVVMARDERLSAA